MRPADTKTIARESANMAENNLDFFALCMTPEVSQRLTRLTDDTLQLLQDRTQTPEEALIVLDAVRRTIEAAYGITIVAPINDQATGHS